MAITSINGTPWDNLTSISGTPKSSITNVSGIPTPSPGPSCTTVAYGYSDGRREPPEAACTNFFITWDYDSAANTLYIPRQCGVTPAPVGYYSDGAQLYFFDGNTLNDAGPCGR